MLRCGRQVFVEALLYSWLQLLWLRWLSIALRFGLIASSCTLVSYAKLLKFFANSSMSVIIETICIIPSFLISMSYHQLLGRLEQYHTICELHKFFLSREFILSNGRDSRRRCHTSCLKPITYLTDSCLLYESYNFFISYWSFFSYEETVTRSYTSRVIL